jgi:two-component system, NarL family, nitrate/nitrite response regulator NarL
MNSPRVGIVSHRTLMRAAVALLLERHGADVFVISEQDHVEHAIEAFALNVIIFDLEGRRSELVDEVARATMHRQQPRVIAIGTAIQAAAAEHVGLRFDDQSDPADLIRGVRSPLVLSTPAPAQEDGLVQSARAWRKVTRRQRELLGWLAEGADNLRISALMNITERTVKAHVSSMFSRFALQSRTELALVAYRAGFRPPLTGEPAAQRWNRDEPTAVVA